MGITQTCLIICGTWIGWGILRYFAPNLQNRHLKGNCSEDFELQYLFPPILRFPVRQIANITYAIFKNIGCCETQSTSRTKLQINSQTNNLLSDNLNELVLGLSHAENQQSGEDVVESDTDKFTQSVMNNKYGNKDINDLDTKRRQQAKALIEQRLQKIQKEYNQRVITGASL
eukprot:UN09914